jgi:hypothetical protein
MNCPVCGWPLIDHPLNNPCVKHSEKIPVSGIKNPCVTLVGICPYCEMRHPSSDRHCPTTFPVAIESAIDVLPETCNLPVSPMGPAGLEPATVGL